MAENLGPEHRTLSYTNVIVCIILEINLMLQFVPKKSIIYEASSESTLYSSLFVGKNLSCLPPTQPSELSPLLRLSDILVLFNNWAWLPSPYVSHEWLLFSLHPVFHSGDIPNSGCPLMFSCTCLHTHVLVSWWIIAYPMAVLIRIQLWVKQILVHFCFPEDGTISLKIWVLFASSRAQSPTFTVFCPSKNLERTYMEATSLMPLNEVENLSMPSCATQWCSGPDVWLCVAYLTRELAACVWSHPDPSSTPPMLQGFITSSLSCCLQLSDFHSEPCEHTNTPSWWSPTFCPSTLCFHSQSTKGSIWGRLFSIPSVGSITSHPFFGIPCCLVFPQQLMETLQNLETPFHWTSTFWWFSLVHKVIMKTNSWKCSRVNERTEKDPEFSGVTMLVTGKGGWESRFSAAG